LQLKILRNIFYIRPFLQLKMLKLKTFKGGYDGNFSYVLFEPESKEAMIVDTSLKPELLLEFIKENKLRLQSAVVMHSHFDHMVSLDYYRKNKISLYGSENLPFEVDRKLKEGDELGLGQYKIKVISAPGHTPDCILLYVDGKLFTTDVLFIDGYGRCDLAGGDAEKMRETLKKIKNFPDETMICPGHDYGRVPFDTLGEQKKSNLCLR